jgi:hypothetical protein
VVRILSSLGEEDSFFMMSGCQDDMKILITVVRELLCKKKNN